MGDGGRISMLRIICRIGVKSFFYSVFFPAVPIQWEICRVRRGSGGGGSESIRNVSFTS
jgi:hypothetical protein